MTTLPVVPVFRGAYRFLSNFWPVDLVNPFDHLVYPSVEHAYQAEKTLDPHWRAIVRQARTPGDAKRLGRQVPVRSGWSDSFRLGIMRALLRAKFRDPALQPRLLETGEATLIEGNDWGDRFWGVYKGQGENHLGILLMDVRAEIREAEAYRPRITDAARRMGLL